MSLDSEDFDMLREGLSNIENAISSAFDPAKVEKLVDAVSKLTEEVAKLGKLLAASSTDPALLPGVIPFTIVGDDGTVRAGVTAIPKPECDGDHPMPACDDPQCWQRSPCDR